MTPAVTAMALIRLARVEMSTLAKVGDATEEQADSARRVLNGVDERSVGSADAH